MVLRAKEARTQRPHGHILRTGRTRAPEESSLTSTVWMAGVFHSMVTQGHVSINRFLSTAHSWLGLFRSHGLRVFVRVEGRWQLLGVPSAFELRPGLLPLDLPPRPRRPRAHERGRRTARTP